jgi:hypothetical protein
VERFCVPLCKLQNGSWSCPCAIPFLSQSKSLDFRDKASIESQRVSNPKKHHFLPVCYLLGFTDSEGRLAIFDRENQSYRSQRPASAGFEKYLYSWILPNGSKDQGLEAQFSDIEGHFPSIRDALEKGQLLTQDELDPLFAFVALQLFRVPATLGDMERLTNSSVDEFLADELNAQEFVQNILGDNKTRSSEELGSVIGEFEARFSRRNVVLRLLLEQAKEAYLLLYEKPALTVVHAPTGKRFLTSDRPVLVHKKDASALGVNGLPGRGSRVFMPLSKSIGINFGEGLPSLFHREIGRADLAALNSALARTSSSLLFSDSEQRLKAIVGKTRLTTAPKLPSISRDTKRRNC